MDEPEATKEVSKKINAINKEAVHRICSGQVVVDLAVAVKELVENSLDSGATSIEIKLVDYGKTCISVIDNGSGVEEKDFEGLGLKHHTSKLKEFSDLLGVETFGFRGEALSSLCSLSNLSIITRHSLSPHAFNLEFDKNGILVEKKECARQQGTTVHVKNIFKNLPVRAKEFEKNIKKEYSKMIQVLYSYCLVSKGVKINCTNTIGNKSPNVVVSTNGVDNVVDNIIAIFGRKAKESLIEVQIEPPDEHVLEEYNLPSGTSINFTWDCFASSCSHTLGRASPDRQFFYVNRRPCDPTKINKLINHVYHKYNNKQYPFIYFDIRLDQSDADVNVTPDKRTILFTQEKIILATIKSSFEKVWCNMQGAYATKTLEDLNFKVHKRRNPDVLEGSPPAKKQFIKNSNESNGSSISIMEQIKNKINNLKTKESKIKLSSISNKTNNVISPASTDVDEMDTDNGEAIVKVNEKEKEYERTQSTESCEKSSEESEVEINHKLDSSVNENGNSIDTNTMTDSTPNKNEEETESLSDEEPVIRTKLPDTEMIISLESIKAKLIEVNEIRKKLSDSMQNINRIKYRTKLDSKSTDVEKELEKELTKESFQEMQVIGQFNLGFILTKLNNDIFIIDQHASDEKFRFEKLSNETKLKTQKLIIPKPLNLAVLNETILIENQNIFESNGFTFNIANEDNSGNKVSLTGMPVSYGWQFNQEDIEELIFLIREGGSDGSGVNKIPRPSRVRQMLASRACRGAVMIGKALNLVDMRRLITQMSQMKNPWNCPHGRPTLRHLVSLTLINK